MAVPWRAMFLLTATPLELQSCVATLSRQSGFCWLCQRRALQRFQPSVDSGQRESKNWFCNGVQMLGDCCVACTYTLCTA